MPTTKSPSDTFSDEVDVCCHRVSFYFEMGRRVWNDDLLDALKEEAENRAKAMISEGYQSGELCMIWRGSKEFFGHWSIIRD